MGYDKVGAMDIEAIISSLGGGTVAAQRLGMKRTTILMWRKRGRVPPQHVPLVARALGVAPETIWAELSSHPLLSERSAA